MYLGVNVKELILRYVSIKCLKNRLKFLTFLNF